MKERRSLFLGKAILGGVLAGYLRGIEEAEEAAQQSPTEQSPTEQPPGQSKEAAPERTLPEGPRYDRADGVLCATCGRRFRSRSGHDHHVRGKHGG